MNHVYVCLQRIPWTIKGIFYSEEGAEAYAQPDDEVCRITVTPPARTGAPYVYVLWDDVFGEFGGIFSSRQAALQAPAQGTVHQAAVGHPTLIGGPGWPHNT